MINLDLKIELLVLVITVAIPVAYYSISNTQFGFYLIVCLSFLSSWIGRLTRMDLSVVSLAIDLLAIVALAGLFIQNMIKRENNWLKKDLITICFLAYTFYLIVEFFNPNASSFVGSAAYLKEAFINLFFFLIALYIFNSLHRIRFFLKFMFGIAFIAGLYGCYQKWIGFMPFELRWIYSDPRIVGLYILPDRSFRKFSFLSDPATFGTLMASISVGALLLSFGPFSLKKKLTASIIALISLMSMAYSGTRTAYAMVPAGILLYIIMTIYKKKTLVLLTSLVLLIAGINFAPIYGNMTINRIRSAFHPKSDNSNLVRDIDRHKLQPYFMQHPFGGGLNTTGGGGNKYNQGSFLASIPPDSGYLSITMQTGWVGLILTCALFFVVLMYSIYYFYSVNDNEIRTYYAVIASMLFALMVGNYSQFTITMDPQNFYYFPFLAALIKLHTFDKPDQQLKFNS